MGLIVCYNSCASNGNGSEHNGALSSNDDNDACTEVYISGIQPDSVAGRDGRLREGDQILQINGKDIKNKEETELLIAENNNAVTLLVSRYLFAVIIFRHNVYFHMTSSYITCANFIYIFILQFII